MIRFAILALSFALCMWAPWMDKQTPAQYAEYVLAAYGAMPATCYDSDQNLLQDGVEVRWYPLGRLVHTCTGDFVVWLWGDVKELGGVTKKSEEIKVVYSKSLTCDEVLKRQQARQATSTDALLVPYAGTRATEPDFSIFPEAEKYKTIITVALRGGVDFAGRFAVVEWECGTNCQDHAVVDVETGQVVAFGLETEFGVSFSRDSTLLVTNPVENMPELSDNPYEMETTALSIARLPREYFRLTHDVLSNTRYLVRECVESSATGYIEVEDDRIGVLTDEE